LEREEGENVTAAAILRYTAPLMLGLTWRWEGEYISYNPPERSAVRMQWGSMFRPFRKLAGSWILTPEEQGTLLKITVQFEPRIPLFEGLVTRRVSRVTTESLIRLRKLTMDSAI
jgi:ribosome-associated toxin RatA of RatAB toxin-antitoxin module